MSKIPLGVLDLVPVTSGQNPTQALHNSLDLVRHADRFGYHRYWFAEHHLNAGTASVAPAVLTGLVAGSASRIRLGSGAVLMGHRTALATAEEFGLLERLHPGRIDLGLGASAGRLENRNLTRSTAPADADRTERGLRVPPITGMARFIEHARRSPLFRLTHTLLSMPGAEPPAYADQVGDILDMLAGRFSRDGLAPPVVPAAGSSPEIWIMGSTAGDSARVAGRYGLRFAASYHVSPGTALDAVEAYRGAFEPSEHLRRPYVAVSADVVVGPDEATARQLASGYGPWVHSARTARGVVEYPSPDEAAAFRWDDDGRQLVADRVGTQVVGDPATVADELEKLHNATDADELVITTIVHDHAERVRSYQLLAEEWRRRGLS